MNDNERREFESLIRVRNFGAANLQELKNNAKAVAGFNSLGADLDALEATGAFRSSSVSTRGAATSSKAAAKAHVYSLVRQIAKTADTIVEEEPDFDNKFDLPRRTLNFQDLLETARAYIKDAPAAEAKFIEYGLKPDFIRTLTNAVAAAEQAANEQNAGQSGSIGANADTDAILKRALQTKRMLNTIVRNIFAGNPAKLAEWAAAFHVERAPKKNTGGENPPQP